MTAAIVAIIWISLGIALQRTQWWVAKAIGPANKKFQNDINIKLQTKHKDESDDWKQSYVKAASIFFRIGNFLFTILVWPFCAAVIPFIVIYAFLKRG